MYFIPAGLTLAIGSELITADLPPALFWNFFLDEF
jgi:hypothetical protein